MIYCYDLTEDVNPLFHGTLGVGQAQAQAQAEPIGPGDRVISGDGAYQGIGGAEANEWGIAIGGCLAPSGRRKGGRRRTR